MQLAGVKGFRLSLQQAHLWTGQPERQPYRALCAVRLKGNLDSEVFQQAVRQVVERHAILRTAFQEVAGLERPMQVVAPQTEVSYSLICLADLSQAQQGKYLRERFAAAQQEPFDLAQGPLLRLELLRLSAQEHVLLLCLPALCADSATLKHLVAEVSQAYHAQPGGERLSEEPLQYVDVSAWQDELLQEDDAELHQEYWRKIDLSQLSSLRLPFQTAARDVVEGQEKDFAPQVHAVPMQTSLQRQLHTLAHQLGVSVEVFLLGCWQVLLWRLTGQSPCLLGVSCDGRYYEELTAAIGLYSRVVPLSMPLTEDTSLAHVLRQVHTSLQQTVEEQLYFRWEETVPSASSQERPSFFPLSFEFEAWPTSFESGQIRFSLEQRFSCMERFVLKLSALEVGQDVRLELHYDPSHFSDTQMSRLGESLLTLLHGAVSRPQTPIGVLPLLNADQQQQVLAFSRPQLGTYQPGVQSLRSLRQRFEAQVEQRPTQLAVVATDEQLSYEQLNRRANQLAHYLRRQGVRPNVLVGLCVERSVQSMVGLLAILKAGGAYVPLDPALPTERLAYQLADVQAQLLLSQHSLLDRLPTSWQGLTLCLDAQQPQWESEPTSNPQESSGPEDLMYVIYTSGSTGVPKGVLIRQQSVSNYTQYMCGLIAQEPGLHFATVSTLAADLGNTAIFCSLASGGCLHILTYETVTSGQAFAAYGAQYPLDVLKIVPSHLSALLSACSSAEQAQQLLPRRCLVLGGEALSWRLVERLRELEASCCVINHYGPTETTIGALVNVLGSAQSAAPCGQQGSARRHDSVPIGRPIANSEAYVLDGARQLAPIGVLGEVYLGGVGLAVGYLHQQEQTRERFVSHPWRDEEQVGDWLYRTGDLGYWNEEGQLVFVGRADSQVKLRGYRIELGEIEAVLGRHANVRDCVVVMVREEESEQPTEGRLVAYVVAQQPLTLSSQELRNFASEQLPAYMLPSIFVLMDELPLTANGKVDRSKLPVPEQSKSEIQPTLVEPRSPIEEILAEIWSELLAIKQIGIHDNFFSLGGHSLLATQVIARLHQVLRVDLPILSLFEAPTVAKLAERVERVLRSEQGTAAPPLVPVSREQDLPLSFAQQRLWFLDQLEPGRASYSKPTAVRLCGKLEVKALAASLEEMVRRHESLRTTFAMKENAPVQVIRKAGQFHLPLAELSRLSLENREIEMQRLANWEAQRPFDLTYGPLLRTTLLRLDEEEHVLLLSMHHIVSDGWSNSIFLGELTTLYNAFVAGQLSPLPELPLQYADFAAWQRQWLQGEVLESQVRYWTEQLHEVAPLELPTDHPRPAVQTFRGTTQSLLLPAQLSEELKRLSQREGVTLFMTLLAVFQALLARYTGQDDISVGTPIANRTHADLESLIGFFVNTLVLRTDLSCNPSFQEVLARVREACLGAYAHQDVPFEKLVEVLQPERDLSRSPLFQVMFGLQHAPRIPQTLQGV
ncbi:MAG TPA: amino acid adenylation domain-containing protein, partial [Ktedonobacteraceae bacterium]|nr:amino acid adenylation domain-containing protein [Ktedonobacteraceae bacterium]